MSEYMRAVTAAEISHKRHNRPIHIAADDGMTLCGIAHESGAVLVVKRSEYEDFEGVARWCMNCERAYARQLRLFR